MNAWILLLVVVPMVAAQWYGKKSSDPEASYGFYPQPWTSYGLNPYPWTSYGFTKSNWGITYGPGRKIVRCFPPKHPYCRGDYTRY
ncbi:hypothetical protein L596_030579 [Steinernema carpocapsae]|uniref:Uncharacterized protein n=1 Tax=Steinernema carpocapsae TaxID=34508 RepID=A0A4U5LPS7_STECR|nr:hypothetical protein L596_030579 [Steinernema carpocapsae]